MELLKLLQSRRSIRKYAGERISDETLEKILLAGLLAPSSRAIYPVELVAVRDKEMLCRLSECKAAGAAMLKDADAAIVVVGDTAKSDAWIEDCSITMTLMMLEATEQGVGNCWVQCRGRQTSEGQARKNASGHSSVSPKATACLQYSRWVCLRRTPIRARCPI